MKRLSLSLLFTVALLCGCAAFPPTPVMPATDQLQSRLPQLFADDKNSYIVVAYPQYWGGGLATHRIFLNDGPPALISNKEAIIWKVSPGIHKVTYDMWLGSSSVRAEVFEGDRVIFFVSGSGHLLPQNFSDNLLSIGEVFELGAYFDISQSKPFAPPRQRR